MDYLILGVNKIPEIDIPHVSFNIKKVFGYVELVLGVILLIAFLTSLYFFIFVFPDLYTKYYSNALDNLKNNLGEEKYSTFLPNIGIVNSVIRLFSLVSGIFVNGIIFILSLILLIEGIVKILEE